MIHLKVNNINFNVKESQLEKLFYSMSDCNIKAVRGLEEISDNLAALDNLSFMLKRREVALKLLHQKINYKTLFDVVYDIIILGDEIKKLDISTHEHFEYNIDINEIIAKAREHKSYKKLLNYILKAKEKYKNDAEFILFLYYWKDDLKEKLKPKKLSNSNDFVNILEKIGFHLDDVAEIIVKESGEIFLTILKELINAGANTDLLIEYAVLRADIEFIAEILANNSNPNIKDHNGETLLGLAVERGDVIIVETLLNHKVDINLQNINGETALLKSCKKLDLTIIELLLINGADPNISDNIGNRPIFASLFSNNLNLINYLIKYKAEYKKITYLLDPVHIELRKKYIEIFTKLINLNKEQYKKILAENLISPEAQEEYLKEFEIISKNKNLSVDYGGIITPNNQNQLINKNKQTRFQEEMELILIDAVINQDEEHVLRLLQQGVSPNITNKFELNHSHLIHYAIWHDNYNITKYLLDFKTNINILDVNGDSPIFFATFRNNLDIVKLLLSLGADPYLTNYAGISAYDLAVAKNMTDFINLMKQAA